MITSKNNNYIKNINLLQKKARERRAQRLFVCEGIRAVKEVPVELLRELYYVEGFEATVEGREFISNIKSSRLDILCQEVSTSVFSSISETVTPQGILAVVSMKEFSLQEVLGAGQRPPHVIILESLQDPGNMGTIIRTAEGAGATGIIMNKGTVDIYSPKVVRATMGSIFRVPHLVVEDFEGTICKLKAEHGVDIYAAHLKGQSYYDEFDYKKPCAFMIGNEGNGLTKSTADLASSYLKIPMEGQLESLNASVAASILMYEVHRQRFNS